MIKYNALGSVVMKENSNYIDYIINNLDLINDNNLKIQILKLINERNQLLSIVKKDSLTGAYNRRVLDNINDFSVVALCDIDDFKTINDTYGHDIGDRVLKNVTKTLIDNTRGYDVVCRYGGDEFLIVFKNCSLEIVKKRMEIVSKIIINSFKNTNINVSFSVGISCFKEGLTLEDIIKEADIALYNTKENGKSGITVYNSSYKKVYNK